MRAASAGATRLKRWPLWISNPAGKAVYLGGLAEDLRRNLRHLFRQMQMQREIIHTIRIDLIQIAQRRQLIFHLRPLAQRRVQLSECTPFKLPVWRRMACNASTPPLTTWIFPAPEWRYNSGQFGNRTVGHPLHPQAQRCPGAWAVRYLSYPIQIESAQTPAEALSSGE